MIVTRFLKTIADSGIPSFVYISAVDPSSLADPARDATRYRTHLRQIAPDARRAHHCFCSRSASAGHGLTFRDIAHTTYDAPMANFLADALCTHLKAIDAATNCTPIARPQP